MTTPNTHASNLAVAALNVVAHVIGEFKGELYDGVIAAIEKANGNQAEAMAIAVRALRLAAGELADESKPITEAELSGTLIVVIAALVLSRSTLHVCPIPRHHNPPNPN